MNEDKLEDSLVAHEGVKVRPYVDTTGNVSIGVGRNLTANGISSDECQLMLQNDIKRAVDACQDQGWWILIENDDVRSRAIIEMVFNLGMGGLNTFTKAIAALKAGDWATAANEFMNSVWASQVGQRAVTLTEMLRTGQDPS